MAKDIDVKELVKLAAAEGAKVALETVEKRAAEGQERPKGQTVKKYKAAVKKLPFAEGAL